LTAGAACARILDVSGDSSPVRDRLLVGMIAGAACGASVGLIAFGDILFVPAVTMLVGGAAGVMVAGRRAGRQATLSELLEVVFEAGAGVPAREPSPPARPRSSGRPAGARPAAARRARRPPPTGPPPPLPAGRAPIDINTADIEELEALPGVVHAGAARIVAYRNAHGAFDSLDELSRVWGFDEARVAYLAHWATLSESGEPGPATAVAEAPAPAAGTAPAVSG
jgi:competence protein ComEA